MLHFQVKNQSLSLSEDSDLHLYCGARKFVRFRVDFSEEWDGYFTVMRFWREGERPVEIADVTSGEEYFVPHEVMEEAGSFYVSCIGTKKEHSLATAESIRIDVAKTQLSEECAPAAEPSPTLLEEFVRLLNRAAEDLSLQDLAFRTTDTHLQWRYVTEPEESYRDFIALEEIRGEKGETGERGERGIQGEQGESGLGLCVVENADADELTTPGIYLCLTGVKKNFPDDSVITGQGLLFVTTLLDTAGQEVPAQTFLLQSDSNALCRIYNRVFDASLSGNWGAWATGAVCGESSVGVTNFNPTVYKTKTSKNLLDPAAKSAKLNYYLDGVGALVRNISYATSDYIPITAGNYVYRRLLTGEQIMSGAFYDADKQYVSSFGSSVLSGENCFPLTFETEGFVRLSYRKDGLFPQYVMFASGDESTPFVPYDLGASLLEGKRVGYGKGLILDSSQFALGKYNSFCRGDSNTALVIGNGSGEEDRSNAFRLDYYGRVYAQGAYNSSGADYAEYFEWEDQNPDGEDRTGRLVTLKGEYIALAGKGDRPFGIVSAAAAILGDAADGAWHGRYQRDVFGRMLTEKEEDGSEHFVVSEEYDPAKAYLPRSERREWAPVGLIGKLVCIDDGSLCVGDMVESTDGGVATRAAGYSPFYVMRRIDEGHVLVFVR